MVKIEIIDTFSGAGGTTEGFEQARAGKKKIARVIACINHDPVAIESHRANHKKAMHFTEDIKNFDVKKFPAYSKNAIRFLWASLECTNFSNAKGGKPREADSRTLANHLFRYIEHLEPDYIGIENVREFMSWGELDRNGKPISRDKGKDYLKWINKVKSYGYEYDWRLLNSADYGAYTSRTRLFIIFAKKGLPIKFPEPTHSKKGDTALFKTKKWKAVKDVLDFSDEGISIFGRKKELSEKTLGRIYEGLEKFIPGDENFIVKYMGNNQKTGINTGKSINVPLNTITTQNRLGVVKVNKLFAYSYISEAAKDLKEPFYTITTQPQHAIVNAEYLINYNHTSKTNDINLPAPTLLTKDKYAKIKPVYFMDYQYSEGQKNKSIELPSGSLTTIPKQNIVRVEKAFIMNRQYNNIGSSIEKPGQTIIASQGKRPQYLIVTELGELAIEIYETDSNVIKKIKRFMAEHGLIDVKMRMLKVPELLKIQGFPDGYILKGNQTQQKKYIGNSVVPLMSKKLIEALYQVLHNKGLIIRKAA